MTFVVVLELLDKAAASRPPPTVKKASSKSSLIDADDEPDATIASPKALAPTCKLKPYQMEGLTWLVSQYNKVIIRDLTQVIINSVT